jgi:YVTN family beta-propeller protein
MRSSFVVLVAATFALFVVSCTNPASDDTDDLTIIPSDDPTIPGEDPAVPGGINIAVGTVAADYSAGNFEIVSFAPSSQNYTISANLLPGLYTDIAVRSGGGYVYVLERDGRDNIIKYDPKDKVLEYQHSLGTGLNVQDIAVVSSTKAYISNYNNSNLIVFNTKTAAITSSINLSQFNTYAGTDSVLSHPYMGALAVWGDYLYVACQRLKGSGWDIDIADTSLIAVIDAAADIVVGSIKLSKKNPAAMHVSDGIMLVASQGSWSGSEGGGIEMIDLISRQNMGLVVDGDVLGGTPTGVVLVSPSKAYAAVMSASSWVTEIVEFDPSSSVVKGRIEGIGDGFGGMVYDAHNSKLYIGDRDFASSGVAVINVGTNAVEKKIQTGMPPSSLAVFFAD